MVADAQGFVLTKLRTLGSELRAEEITHVALFGPRARGDNSAASDIDLLLDIDLESRFSILNLVGVEQIAEKAVGISANGLLRRSLDENVRNSIKEDLVEVF
jgi:uncharacterized protein